MSPNTSSYCIICVISAQRDSKGSWSRCDTDIGPTVVLCFPYIYKLHGINTAEVSGLVTTAFGNQKNLPKLMCYINTKVGLEPKLVQIPILPFYLVSLKSILHWKCSIPKIPGCCTTSSYISLYATQHAFWLFCPTSSAQKIRWWHYSCADH